MFVASVIFGGIVGILAPLCRETLVSCGQTMPVAKRHGPIRFSATLSDYVFSLLLLSGCFAIVFSDSLFALCASAFGATLIVQIQRRGSLKALFTPLSSFWVLFAFIACINLFFSYGTALERFPLFTHEGVELTVRQWLRLWTWLEVSFILSFFNFHAVILTVLQKLFPHHRSTLFAGVLGLEYFPAIASDGRALVKNAIASFFFHPLKNVESIGARQSQGQKTGLSGIITRWTNTLYEIVIRRMESA
jgi:hypothetical protein